MIFRSYKQYVLVWFFMASTYRLVFAGPYIAFSLREAAYRAQVGETTTELLKLAGITRILGMVHDPNGDIIIVGRVFEGQPEATLDDLVVALRSRLIYNQWPTVSIDPTVETYKTGLQEVRFYGGLAGTQFGQDFLNCDIFLKNYSLELLPLYDPVESYRFLCATDMKTKLASSGVQVIQVQWQRAKDTPGFIETLRGQNIKWEGCNETRFWFAPQDPSHFVTRGGVFCIEELRLCVKQELIKAVADSSVHQDVNSPDLEKAGELFAGHFSEHFWEMTALQPLLKRLKILYDLVAVAEGVRSIEPRPDLSYFLEKYPINHPPTATEYELIQMFGYVQRDDGLQHVVRISGGIKLETELKWLNDGDVTPLRDIVLKTRPSLHTLSWTLPLNSWQMPNSRYLDLEKPAEFRCQPQSDIQESHGCTVFTQAFVLSPTSDKQLDIKKLFSGFPPPPPPPPFTAAVVPRIEYAEKMGGVSMKIEPNEESYQKDSSGKLDKRREDALKSRPNRDSLTWPAKKKGD